MGIIFAIAFALAIIYLSLSFAAVIAVARVPVGPYSKKRKRSNKKN